MLHQPPYGADSAPADPAGGRGKSAMQQDKARADAWRERAEELRAIAESWEGQARAELVCLAREYEEMAARLNASDKLPSPCRFR